LLLIVTAAYWKLLTKQFTWMDHPDMAYQVLPWFQFQAVSWHHGEFPIWDPHGWAGQPLLGQLQPGAAYPPNWLLFLRPLRDGHIQPLWLNIYFILTHYLAGLFCYWLCRDVGRSPPASILAGSAFALTGVVGSIGWPQMLNGAIWTPLPFLFFLRSSRGERPLTSAALCGTFLGISFLSGHHQIPTFIALMIASLWLLELWRRRSQALAPFAVFLLFAGMVSAFQTLPAYEYGVRSIRWVGSQNPVFWGQYVPYSVHQDPAHALSPLGILGFVLPHLAPHDVFVGVAILTLAFIGLTASFATREVRLLGSICVAGLLVALGGFSVFHGLAYLLLPMVDKARTPAMALVVVQFALAVLCAYGLDAIREAKLGRWWIPAIAAAGILPWPVLAVVASVRAETALEYQHAAVFAMVASSLAAILYAWQLKRISARTGIVLLFIVVLFELGTVVGANFRHREKPGGYLAELEKNGDIVQFLRSRPDFVRLEVDTNAVPYNIGDWDGIDQFRAYLGGMTSNVARFEQDRLEGGRLALTLFALNYFLGKEPIRSGQEEVFRGKSGLVVYRNPEAFPRAWIVHESHPVEIPELIARLRSADLRRQAFIPHAAPALEQCVGHDEVRALERSDNRLLFEAKTACRGMVIVSETFYPGWKATIDGRTVPIYEAYGALRGVVVDGGEHRIEFRYRPMLLILGAFLTVIGLTLALLSAIFNSHLPYC
jgi:hypothetical protein